LYLAINVNITGTTVGSESAVAKASAVAEAMADKMADKARLSHFWATGRQDTTPGTQAGNLSISDGHRGLLPNPLSDPVNFP